MARKDAAEFWRNWTPWRHGDPGEGNFTDVMRVLGLYPHFARFIADHVEFTGPVNVLDLGCGAAQLAGPLAQAFAAKGKQLARYTGIDFADREWMPARVEREFARVGLSGRGDYIHHDLFEPLPELPFGPEPLVMTSCWCLTYLGPTRMASILAELMALVKSRPEPTWLLLNMLTGGRFDRQVLTRQFLREIVPKQLWASLSQWKREPAHDLRLAMKALPRMRMFGDQLAEHVILMEVPEVIAVAEEAGCSVVNVDASALWGQTTSLAIRLRCVGESA